MSGVELHHGILIKVNREGLSVEEWIKKYVKNYAKINPSSYVSKHIDDLDFDYKEAFCEVTQAKGYIVTKNHIFTYYDELLNNDYFVDIYKNANGTYSYTAQFHNVDTCLSEVLENGLKQVRIYGNVSKVYDET